MLFNFVRIKNCSHLFASTIKTRAPFVSGNLRKLYTRFLGTEIQINCHDEWEFKKSNQQFLKLNSAIKYS